MTHWSHSGIAFTEGHDDAEILWGYPPAEKIDEGVQRLIARLYAELRRYPEVAEIDEHIYGPTTAPEIIERHRLRGQGLPRGRRTRPNPR